MKTKLPWILFGLSLVLNLAVLAGYVHSGLQAARIAKLPLERSELVARRLHLDESQRQAFRELREQAQHAARDMRGENRRVLLRLWRELAAPQPDQAAVDNLVKQLGASQAAFNGRVVGLIRKLMETLDAEQQHQLLRLLQRKNIFAVLAAERSRDESKTEGLGTGRQ